MIEAALRDTQTELHELTAIAFSRGPGSFSGVRINAAVTQALAWANDLPVIAVSTLQALAQAAYQTHQLQQVTAVLDARMQEVYLANYVLDDLGIMQLDGEERLLNYADAQAAAQFTVVGSGAHLIATTETQVAAVHQMHITLHYLQDTMHSISNGCRLNRHFPFTCVTMRGKKLPSKAKHSDCITFIFIVYF